MDTSKQQKSSIRNQGVKMSKKKEKVSIINTIELGLNILAQDLIFKKHTEEDINHYVNRFKFARK